MAYPLVKVSSMRELYREEIRKRDKVRRQAGNWRGPSHAGFSSYTQESQIAPQMRACRQEHLGNWQTPLTCSVLLPPFLKVITAELPLGSNFSPHLLRKHLCPSALT